MSPEECIAALDNALAEAGENVILRRLSGAGSNVVNVDVTCRAQVRNWRLKEEVLVAEFRQAIMLVIISPTDIAKAQWPGGVVPGQTVDPSIPRRNDKLVIKGRLYNIEACEAIAMNGVNVRFEMQALG